jgi:fatty-acyl-CoA synthase
MDQASSGSPYDTGLDRNPANFTALTPISFLDRAADVYRDRTSIIHGARRFTWSETLARCRRLASALVNHGVRKGDTVAAMLSNTPEMLECHFGVPMSGGVLNTLNTRLDAQAISFMLDHADARVLLVDGEFSATIRQALATARVRPMLIDVDDPMFDGGGRIGGIDYETFIATGDDAFPGRRPDDEWDAISLNYTSGTTGNPKGVVYHHRGAYLNAIGNALACGMGQLPVYLWTLPMFHCNGWCFPWTVTAMGGTHVCLRKVDPAQIFDLIRRHRVTHYCGAPIVHATLINAPPALRDGIAHRVSALVAGAAPPVAMIEGMAAMGFDLCHVYGLTETYGPAAVCAKLPEWEVLSPAEQAVRNGRQGVRYVLQEGLTVMDPETMAPTPPDGTTIGEVMFRGNATMKGYLANPKATEEAFRGGWFHTGDLAVLQPDGYVKIKDRAKDIIISGGENISSLEVEDVLSKHPAVLSAAVVAKPDPKWGETPCAFIELKPGATATAGEVIAFCRLHMAGFKVPRDVVFGPLPRTSTGKIQKFVLREQVRSTQAIDG